MLPFTTSGSNYEQEWGHSQMGSYTDFVILAVGLVFFFFFPSNNANVKFFLLFQGLGFGIGGFSHYLMDGCYADGGLMSFVWNEGCSAWMYPWVPATIFVFITNYFLLIGASWQSCRPDKNDTVKSCITGLFALMVAFTLICSYDITGMFALMSGSVLALTSLLVGIVGMVQGVRKNNKMFVMGSLLIVAGWILLLFKPAACTTPADLDACPFPKAFNHNCIFHVLLILSMCCLQNSSVSEALAESQESSSEDSSGEDVGLNKF